jgi:hypothetical protein
MDLPVRVLPIPHSVYRVGVSLCQAQISLVGGTWKGFLMTLLGLKIIEWTAVSDFDHEDGGLTGPRSSPNQPNRSLRYQKQH